jgi:hypothetical protein
MIASGEAAMATEKLEELLTEKAALETCILEKQGRERQKERRAPPTAPH